MDEPGPMRGMPSDPRSFSGEKVPVLPVFWLAQTGISWQCAAGRSCG